MEIVKEQTRRLRTVTPREELRKDKDQDRKRTQINPKQ